ncbi:MAG: alpha/beta fold hydrolase [Actinomycetota bacterium]
MTQPMDLAYEERGSGPALVLIHGFPLNSTMWIEQLKGLAKVRRVIAVDLRGHGYSTIKDTENFSMDLFADDVATTMADIGADQVDLCGLSMGGYVAFAFLRRHRDKVRSIILCDTKAEADTDEGKAGREKNAALVREQGTGALWDMLRDKMFGPSPSQDVLDATKRMFLSTPAEVAAGDALAMRDRPDSTPDLAGIGVPCLWIHGEQDQLMPAEGARATAGKIPGAQFVTIPNAGHMSPLENPDPVNKAMTDFLKSVTPKK